MQPKPRYASIDTARGLALAIMVFYHAWNWLVPLSARQDTPASMDWWLCAVRLAAAPLFILAFGCLLGRLYSGVNSAGIRARLWPRALQVFIVFKLLCFAELWVRGMSWASIHAALGYRDLSNWFQVLHFYALFLALSPWILPSWHRLNAPQRVAVLLGFGVGAAWGQHVDWGAPVLQGLLVGREPFVNYPLLPWSLPALLGISLGERWSARVCLLWAAALLAAFTVLFSGEWAQFHQHIVFSGWKNPPALSYVCIATASGLCWLALCHSVTGAWTAPLQLLGRHPLLLYFAHVLLILLVFGMRYRHGVSDVQGWLLAAVTLGFTYLVSLAAERLQAGRG